MFALLLTLLLIDGLLLTVVVLLQSGKGDGLAAMGGGMGSSTDSLIGGRQAATILTKSTWITGGLFLFLSLLLAIISSRQQRPNSILRDEFKGAPAAAAPAPVQIPGAENAPAGQAAQPAQQTPAPATTNQ